MLKCQLRFLSHAHVVGRIRQVLHYVVLDAARDEWCLLRRQLGIVLSFIAHSYLAQVHGLVVIFVADSLGGATDHAVQAW